MARNRLLILVLILAALLFFLLPSFARIYTDWLWFGEVGYRQVFLKTLATRFGLGAAVFAIALAVLYANIRLAQRALGQRSFTVFGPTGPRTIALDMGRLKPLFLTGAAVAAFFVASYAAARWDIWLMARNAVPFGTVDPILGYDAGFYIFQLPLLQLIYNLTFATIVLCALGVGAAHFAGQNLAFDPARGLMMSAGARRHLSFLVAALFLLFAIRAWLAIPQLLIEPSGIVHGASYVDVYAHVPVQWILVVVAVIGSALAVYQATATRYWPVIAAAGLYVAVAIVGGLYGYVLQRFFVTPNEQVREEPFIRNAIAATRTGFALDQVVQRQLSGETTLTAADIENNAVTIDNIPLWNDQPLLDTFGQIQEIRTYYDFVSVDNDRYVIDGEYRQIMLSARELNSDSLPSRTWINQRLTFTHGYGLTLGPVNEVTPVGLPVLFIQDLPLRSNVDLKVEQPRIYFGELSNDHVFVKTATREFDYPKGDENVFGTYAGKGGVALGNLFRRLLFAVRFASTETFFSPSLSADTRVLLHRDIAQRVRRIAPFLFFDPDPYLAISNGRLVWIQDAYTVSGLYPYSTPAPRSGINYIRNSVKVTIDAYDGTVVFHLVDNEDPIAQTLARVFPGLFRPLTEMPEDLRTRLRYPQGIFALQANMFATFHMTSPATFYNREDQWDIPSLERDGAPMHPYYTLMKLPGEERAEYIQMLPYTPRQKDNLAAWMVARSDGENYGQLMVFEFPKETVIFGPRQIAARISQDEVIAPQITLWNQQGSEVIQGTLLVIPIEESLLYVRPLYLRAAGGRIPELKRVVVAYRNRIVMDETLDAALARLFPGVSGRRPSRAGAAQPTPAPATPAEADARARQPLSAGTAETEALISRAQRHYERAIQAQRAGDWGRYGEEIRQLGEALEQLARE